MTVKGTKKPKKVKEEPRRIGCGERGTPAEARNLKRREERRAIALQKQEAQGASAQAGANTTYLLGQSALFGHFGKGLEERQKKTEEKAAKKSGAASISSSSSSARRGRKGRREKEAADDGMDDERESCWQTS